MNGLSINQNVSYQNFSLIVAPLFLNQVSSNSIFSAQSKRIIIIITAVTAKI